MKHEISFEILSEYVDGKCSKKDSHRIEKHLSQCDSCKQALLKLKQADMVIKNSGRIKTDEAFDAAFKNKLKDRLRLKEQKPVKYALSNILTASSSGS